MGKGKGSVEYWVAQIKPGQVLFEIQGVDEIVAKEAFELAAAKLPVKTKIIKRTIMSVSYTHLTLPTILLV